MPLSAACNSTRPRHGDGQEGNRSRIQKHWKETIISTETQPQSPKNVKVLIQQINQLPHIYQILGMLFIGGAVAMAAYGLGQLGWLDVAATFLTCWGMTFGRLVFDVTSRPAAGADFEKTRNSIATLAEEFKAFTTSRALLGKALIATGAAIGFLAARWVVINCFGFMTNPWIAGAFGLLLASIIASPILWKAMTGSLTEKIDKTQKDGDA